jgi:hypothetical protein
LRRRRPLLALLVAALALLCAARAEPDAQDPSLRGETESERRWEFVQGNPDYVLPVATNPPPYGFVNPYSPPRRVEQVAPPMGIASVEEMRSLAQQLPPNLVPGVGPADGGLQPTTQ